MSSAREQWWFQDARRALWTAVKNDHDEAAAAINRILARDGSVFGDVFLVWIDTLVAHLPPMPSGTVVLWRDEGSGKVETVDEVEPCTRWAGELIQARIANDRVRYLALLGDVAASGEQATEYVASLLTVVAASIRTARCELTR